MLKALLQNKYRTLKLNDFCLCGKVTLFTVYGPQKNYTRHDNNDLFYLHRYGLRKVHNLLGGATEFHAHK
jgi:hypothetical protein